MKGRAALTGWAATDIATLEAPARRRFVIGSLAVLLVSVVAGYLLFWWHGPHHHQYDLRIYYSAVRYWFDGNSIYDYSQPDPVNVSLGYTYPPISAVLMAPMALLPLGVVIATHFVVLVLCNTLLIWLYLRCYWPRVAVFQSLVIAGIVSSFSFLLIPIAQNAAFGQVNLLLGVLVVVDLLVLYRRGSRWTGVGIGLAMALKLTPGVFLLLLVLGRRWRATATACGAALAVIAFGFAVNWHDSVRYYTALIWESDRVGFLDNTTNQSWNGVLARLMSPEQPSRALWLLGSLVLVAVAAVRIRRVLVAGDLLVAVTLTGLLGALVSPVTWLHHIIWVVPVGVVLWRYRWTTGPDGTRRLSARSVALGVTGLYVWLTDIRVVFHLPDINYGAESLGSALIASQQFAWLCAALLLLPYGRRHDDQPLPVAVAAGGERRSATG